jgi:membrane dipeptidase
MTLTHFKNNNWADSSTDTPAHNGLTAFGKDVVRELNRLGVMVDISHVADKTFYDALAVTTAPVIASHSSCRAIANHPRNMTDDMLRALAKNGGVCMINFFSAFISDEVAEVTMHAAKRDRMERPPTEGGTEEMPNDRTNWDEFLKWFQSLGSPAATLEQVADHVFHAADVAGIEHVGIGSDFDGVPALPAGLTDASMLPSLTARLLERGMSEGDAEKVLGGNFMRVFEEVERLSARS